MVNPRGRPKNLQKNLKKPKNLVLAGGLNLGLNLPGFLVGYNLPALSVRTGSIAPTMGCLVVVGRGAAEGGKCDLEFTEK